MKKSHSQMATVLDLMYIVLFFKWVVEWSFHSKNLRQSLFIKDKSVFVDPESWLSSLLLTSPLISFTPFVYIDSLVCIPLPFISLILISFLHYSCGRMRQDNLLVWNYITRVNSSLLHNALSDVWVDQISQTSLSPDFNSLAPWPRHWFIYIRSE